MLPLIPSWLILFSMILLQSGFGDAVTADGPVTLRVLAWNVHHCRGIDGRLDVARIAAVIRELDPDLVALQEVDKNCTRSGNVDQPAELSKLTGLSVVFEKNIDLQGGQYGNAVLSRWPVQKHRNVYLPCLKNGEQRGALIVDVMVPAGESPEPPIPLSFISVHFDHRSDDQERLQSADVINSLLQEAGAQRMLLAGDLNASPESAVLQNILAHWTNTATKPLPTVPVDKPHTQIDYILISPAVKGAVIECRVPEEELASDHRAIFAVIELNR